MNKKTLNSPALELLVVTYSSNLVLIFPPCGLICVSDVLKIYRPPGNCNDNELNVIITYCNVNRGIPTIKQARPRPTLVIDL